MNLRLHDILLLILLAERTGSAHSPVALDRWARELGLSTERLSELLDSLVEAGLVSVSDTDELDLTDEARTLRVNEIGARLYRQEGGLQSVLVEEAILDSMLAEVELEKIRVTNGDEVYQLPTWLTRAVDRIGQTLQQNRKDTLSMLLMIGLDHWRQGDWGDLDGA